MRAFIRVLVFICGTFLKGFYQKLLFRSVFLEAVFQGTFFKWLFMETFFRKSQAFLLEVFFLRALLPVVFFGKFLLWKPFSLNSFLETLFRVNSRELCFRILSWELAFFWGLFAVSFSEDFFLKLSFREPFFKDPFTRTSFRRFLMEGFFLEVFLIGAFFSGGFFRKIFFRRPRTNAFSVVAFSEAFLRAFLLKRFLWILYRGPFTGTSSAGGRSGNFSPDILSPDSFMRASIRALVFVGIFLRVLFWKPFTGVLFL